MALSESYPLPAPMCPNGTNAVISITPSPQGKGNEMTYWLTGVTGREYDLPTPPPREYPLPPHTLTGTGSGPKIRENTSALIFVA